MEQAEIKAREIFNRFNLEVSQEFNSDTLKSATIAKQCALICLDEIIKTYHSPMDDEQIEEWQEVKQHLNNL